jgi:hypothetical protein
VALVRTNVSEELSASIIRVTRIGELGTTLTTALRVTVCTFPYRVTVDEYAVPQKSVAVSEYYTASIFAVKE